MNEVATGVEPDYGETIYSTDRWVCTDDAIASTGAICDKIEEEIDLTKVTEKDNREGRWIQDGSLDDDDHFATTAAITDRLDPYFQDTLPSQPPWRMPGKFWFDNDNTTSRLWDQDNQVWVRAGLGGPPGPTGPTGTYRTIVSDSAPTRRIDNTPLISGDVWFNSTNAELFVWYDDGQPPESSRSKQWVQAVGGAGAQGPEGPPGVSSYTFIAPIDLNGDEVSFDINLLQELPLIMSLKSTDLFYVQRPSGGDAGNYKMNAGELIDFIAGSPAVNYRGTVDCTNAPGGQIDPDPALPGDVYINTGDGTVATGWTGIVGDDIADGQRVLFDGTSWAIVGQAAGGGVETVTGTAPITVGGDAA